MSWAKYSAQLGKTLSYVVSQLWSKWSKGNPDFEYLVFFEYFEEEEYFEKSRYVIKLENRFSKFWKTGKAIFQQLVSNYIQNVGSRRMNCAMVIVTLKITSKKVYSKVFNLSIFLYSYLVPDYRISILKIDITF